MKNENVRQKTKVLSISKMKVSFAEKNLLYFKAGITFQSTVYQRKYYVEQKLLFIEKKVIY